MAVGAFLKIAMILGFCGFVGPSSEQLPQI